MIHDKMRHVSDNFVLYACCTAKVCICEFVWLFSYWLWFCFLHFLSIDAFLFSLLHVCYFGTGPDSICQLVKKRTLTFPSLFLLGCCMFAGVLFFVMLTIQSSFLPFHKAVLLKVKVEWLEICKRKTYINTRLNAFNIIRTWTKYFQKCAFLNALFVFRF